MKPSLLDNLKPLQRLLITPEIAAELLSKEFKNRPLSDFRVSLYERDLRDGRWKFNGDTICITKNGQVIDGQHRLWAVVNSGIAMDTILAVVEEDVFSTKTGGKPRTSGDIFGIMGLKNGRNHAAALIMVDRYVSGSIERGGSKDADYSPTIMPELNAKYPGVGDSVALINGQKQRGLLIPSVAAASHYLFAMKSREDADAFIVDLISGKESSSHDSVAVLRNRLIANTLSKAKISKLYQFALCIKAWNCRRSGIVTKCLRWREEGNAKETFPLIK